MAESLNAYKDIVGQECIDQLYQLAKVLKGLRITHVSSTQLGGGVAEILTNMIPLMQSLGIEARWEIIKGPQSFFECTKDFHNALQGNKILFTPSQLKLYEEVNEKNAKHLRDVLEDSHIVIVNDPQPAALIDHFPRRNNKWIWRCHVDGSRPNHFAWRYLSKFISGYDATVFSLVEFAHALPHPIFVIPPSIDPLSDKNKELSEKEVQEIFGIYGIDPDRPMILQVSRYDRFKDQLGVIEAYRMVKKVNPEVQLVFAGSEAVDDPEGKKVLKDIRAVASDDPDIHILMLASDAHLHVNALQRAATIILQKSIKEGFGLTVTEGLWKAKPVIGGNTGGIKLQIVDKYTGFIVNTPEGAAYRMRYLLQHAEKAQNMGTLGREFVREKFLITRHIRDYLGLAISLMTGDTDRVELDRCIL